MLPSMDITCTGLIKDAVKPVSHAVESAAHHIKSFGSGIYNRIDSIRGDIVWRYIDSYNYHSLSIDYDLRETPLRKLGRIGLYQPALSVAMFVDNIFKFLYKLTIGSYYAIKEDGLPYILPHLVAVITGFVNLAIRFALGVIPFFGRALVELYIKSVNYLGTFIDKGVRLILLQAKKSSKKTAEIATTSTSVTNLDRSESRFTRVRALIKKVLCCGQKNAQPAPQPAPQYGQPAPVPQSPASSSGYYSSTLATSTPTTSTTKA